MKSLGQYWMVRQAEKRFGLRWREFKVLAGFLDYPDTPGSAYLLEHAERLFRTLRNRRGEAALSPDWLASQGFNSLLNLVTVTLGMPWRSFVAHCGADVATGGARGRAPEPSPQQTTAEKPGTVPAGAPRAVQPNIDTLFEHLVPLRKGDVYEIEQVYELHARLLAKHGPDALKTAWLNGNGYRCVYVLAHGVFGFPWHGYLFRFGTFVEKRHPDLAARVWTPVARAGTRESCHPAGRAA
jgi:hypothetical protein